MRNSNSESCWSWVRKFLWWKEITFHYFSQLKFDTIGTRIINWCTFSNDHLLDKMKFNSTLIQSLDKFFHSQRISKIIKFSSSQNHLTENNLEQSSISNDPFYSVKKKKLLECPVSVFVLECRSRNGQTGNRIEKVATRAWIDRVLNYVSVYGIASACVLREITGGGSGQVFRGPTSVSTYNNIPKHVNTLEWAKPRCCRSLWGTAASGRRVYTDVCQRTTGCSHSSGYLSVVVVVEFKDRLNAFSPFFPIRSDILVMVPR